MCVWMVTKKKNKPRLPRIARHSNRTQCTAFPSVALVITAALTGDSRRECVCLRLRCPAEEYLSFLFTLQLVVHFLCVMVNLDSHVWTSLQTQRTTTSHLVCPFDFTSRRIYLPFFVVSFSPHEPFSLHTLWIRKWTAGHKFVPCYLALCNLTWNVIIYMLREDFLCFLMTELLLFYIYHLGLEFSFFMLDPQTALSTLRLLWTLSTDF